MRTSFAQLEVPVPGSMGQTFDLLAEQGALGQGLARQLKKAVGFRSIAVHNYDAINWYMVHSIARDHLADFSRFAVAVVTWLDAH